MGTHYTTYLQFGKLKRGVYSTSQYEALQKDSTISSLQIHPSQSAMEGAFNEATGKPVASKKVLLG